MDITTGDAACLAAIAKELGHETPFTPEELAGLTSLTVTHARSLDVLEACTGLRHLRVLASEVKDFGFCAALPELAHLEVLATTLTSLEGLASCPKLERVDLLFTSASDASDLLGIAALRRGMLVGNPWDDASWAALQEAAARPGMFLELPPGYDWKQTRELWEKIRCGWGAPAGSHRMLVHPGLPTQTKNAFDALLLGAIGHEMRQPAFGLEYMFRDYVSQIVAPDLSELAQSRTLGDAADARRWIAEAAMDDADKADLARLVDRFPGVTYWRANPSLIAREAHGEPFAFPAWYPIQRATLDGWQPNIPHSAIRLDGDDVGEMTMKDWWLGIYPHAAEYGERLLAAGFVNVALSTIDQQAMLAMRLDGNDRQIYAYHFEDVTDAISEGRDVASCFRPAFRSYAAMLGHIVTLLPRDLEPIEAA